jgi:hypothetical protein
MSTSFRILALSTLLAANVAIFANSSTAAERGRDWRYRYYSWHAPSVLISGVRGASPLTVPFFGYGWYPGPAYYYGPPPGLCCRAAPDTIISVKY